MELKAELKYPYTEEERADFIVEQNHKNGYEIREVETTYTEEIEIPYTETVEEIVNVPVCEVANKAKAVPLDYINKDGNDVTQEMLEYLRPLVQGEVSIHYDNGLPEYLNLSHLTHME